MSGIGPNPFNPNFVPTQDAYAEASSSSHAGYSNDTSSSVPQQLPAYRQRLMERVSPEIKEYMRVHGGERVDKNRRNPPASATKIRTPETSYSLQMTARSSKRKEVLGMGKEGKIRRVLREDGAEFAVKKFSRRGREFIRPRAIVIAAEREFSAYQQLGDGPHFAKAFDVIHTEKNGELKSYLIMERLKGMDLRNTCNKLFSDLQARKISGNRVRSELRGLMRQSIEALRDFHESGLVHRDVNALNFFKENSGNVKIIDLTAAVNPGANWQAAQQSDIYGLCNILGEFAGLLSCIGTPEAEYDKACLLQIAGLLQSGQHTLDDILDQHLYFTA